MIQPSYNIQIINYQDSFYAYNQAFYASTSTSEVEEKTEMSEDSCSVGEVWSLCKSSKKVNHNFNLKSASTKGGM